MRYKKEDVAEWSAIIIYCGMFLAAAVYVVRNTHF